MIISCGRDLKEDETTAAIREIPMSVKVDRFDKRFAFAKAEEIPTLRAEYPFLFNQRTSDSVWIGRLNDTIQQEINEEVLKVFPTLEPYQEDLKFTYQALDYHFSRFQPPRLYTVTSYVDYRNRVLVADTLLFVSLDAFLGKNHHFYDGFARYQAQSLSPDHLVPAVAQAYAQEYVPPAQGRTLLDLMVHWGKVRYVMSQILNGASDAKVMDYTDEEWQYAEEVEDNVYRYFISKEYLYTTDPRVQKRFILPAPFTKFGLEIDNDTPGRMGQYLGYKIVQSFMKENNLTLEQLIVYPETKLFKESKYKPAR